MLLKSLSWMDWRRILRTVSLRWRCAYICSCAASNAKFSVAEGLTCAQVDESLSPLESLERYGRSPILEQCLAYLGSAGAAAAGGTAEDITRVILPLLAESVQSEEAVVCIAALQQLPAVGAAPCPSSQAHLLYNCNGAFEQQHQ